MAQRERGYIDTDVYTEAKNRIRHVFDIFDTVAVAFSGGKDSLVALHLVREVADELGITKPTPVIFRDEELIPDQVVDFVAGYRDDPRFDLRWYCLPLESTKFVLGKSMRYVQWDQGRDHLRPMPEWAITLESLGLPASTVVDQYTADAVCTRGMKGKVAVVNGIRANESLNRYSAMMVKLNEPYIVKSSAPRVQLVKPIYDWTEDDIFKYLHDTGVPYCPLYDAQLWSGSGLRVSTPLHAESAKHFHRLRAQSPTFYAQLIDLEPDMVLQERYYYELDRAAVKDRYGASLDGVQQWVEDTLADPAQRKKALRELARLRKSAARAPKAYPPKYVLKEFMAGAYKRPIKPLVAKYQDAEAYK